MENFTKNDRLQMHTMDVSSPLTPFGGKPLLSHTNCYVDSTDAGCPTVAGGINGISRNNGNILGVLDNFNHARDQTFSYDQLNRLVGDAIDGPVGTGSVGWSYDPFGNRQSQAATGSLSFSLTQATSTFTNTSLTNGTVSGIYSNRMDGLNHDASGNVLQYGLTAFTYDGASRVRTAGGVCYVYNAEGIRTAKGTWNGTSCANIASQYLLGRGGEQVTELVGLTGYVAWQHTNVGAGNLMATYDAQGLHFNFTDWLGTKRAQVNADGTIEQTCLSLPFGDALSCDGTGTDATEHHFTGKERDVESGLDYFGARYYGSNMGRWMSPDWAAKVAPVPYARMDDPQSLNLYAYVGNNPLSMADADGHNPGGYGEDSRGDKVPGDPNVNAAAEQDKRARAWANEYARPEPPRPPPAAKQNASSQNTGTALPAPPNSETGLGLVTSQYKPFSDATMAAMYTTTWYIMDLKTGKLLPNSDAAKHTITLDESLNGNPFKPTGDPQKGHANDQIYASPKFFDQRWSIDGKRAQLVVGKNGAGQLQVTWQVHVVVNANSRPVYSPVP